MRLTEISFPSVGITINPSPELDLGFAQIRIYGLLIAVGLLLIFSFSSLWIIALGCIVSGVGYGIVQPYLYDCVTKVSSASKVAFALALLMAMNYVAILVCPFIVDYLQRIMHVESQSFAFGLNAVVAFVVLLAMLAVYICKRKR